MRAGLLLAAAIAAAAGGALAGPPTVADIVVSAERDGPAQATFKPNTAKVYIRTKLVDVPPGAKLRADWIATKTEVAPPNYKVDSIEHAVGAGSTQYHGALGKPSTGWPTGDYRVELFIDGKPAKQAAFKVVR